MSELEPRTVALLDQFSGVIGQIADITVAHHQRLLAGQVPHELARELTGDLHDALLALFVNPPKNEPPDDV